MTWLSRYKSSFRHKVVGDDGRYPTDIAIVLELPKFVLPAAALALVGSLVSEPLRTLLIALGVLIAAAGIVLLTFWWAELKLRAADKRYSLFTRKKLSDEYREGDR